MFFDVKERENINFKPLGSIPYYFVFPKSWDTGLNDFRAVLNNKILILELNNGYNHALELCKRNGFMPSQVKYADSYLKISKAIAEGSCFTIGSRDIAKDSHFQACLSFVQITDYEEQLAAAWTEDRPWIKEFLELL